MSSLTLQNLSLGVDEETWLEGVSLHLEPGALYTLLGRTGSGKTTLIRAIAGLETLDEGSVYYGDRCWDGLAPWKRPVAMVYQQFINYPHLSVLDNVAFPLRRAGVPRNDARDRAQGTLQKLGLGSMLNRRPGELSGGQQQRVAIARALTKEAPVLLMDEPLVNLDYKLREQMREELVELLADRQSTIVIYASTEPAEALQMSSRVLVMDEGRVVQEGAPRQVYGAPCSIAAARVVNDPPLNVLAMSLDRDAAEIESLGYFSPETIFGARPDGHPDDPGLKPGQYYVGIRAGDLALSDTGRPAEVTLTEVSGSETITHLNMAGTHLVMHERAVIKHRTGSHIHITPRLSTVFVFNRDGELVHVAHPGRRQTGEGHRHG